MEINMDNIMTEAIKKHCRKYHYSKEYKTYWINHSFCEICQNFSSAPHHLRTRGAGGSDEAKNLIALCTTHHTEVGTMGVMSFADKYSQFFDKIITALSERDARRPSDGYDS